jgi:hypothetical protein
MFVNLIYLVVGIALATLLATRVARVWAWVRRRRSRK